MVVFLSMPLGLASATDLLTPRSPASGVFLQRDLLHLQTPSGLSHVTTAGRNNPAASPLADLRHRPENVQRLVVDPHSPLPAPTPVSSTSFGTTQGHAPRYESITHNTRNNANAIEYARVLSVTPRISVVRVHEPIQECRSLPGYYVTVPAQESRNSAPAVIAGGIVGGLAGNNIGSGSGRDAARIIGTLAGAAIANDISRQLDQSRPAQRRWVPDSTECSTRTTYRNEERVDGYTVVYEYRGTRYTTETREHPGSHLPVRVSVSPVL